MNFETSINEQLELRRPVAGLKLVYDWVELRLVGDERPRVPRSPHDPVGQHRHRLHRAGLRWAAYDDDADYLDYDKTGRPFMEQMSGSCGTAYFSGIIGGGAYGALKGFSRSPSTKFKIRMNSLMNGAATRGSKAGNALGCLAMVYKAFEYVADSAEIENIVKFDQVTPILASAATGVFYKSTAGPKAMVLAGALGAGLMTVVQFGIKPFYPRL
ncbi:hypothetical protein PInf_028729 [Phytophthora infestans]|nr:hypothetical protein PInf_028729 [Phytophthora infestans]